jgi:hypothetical protein
MGVSINDVTNLDAVLVGGPDIAVDLAVLWIDQHCGARDFASHEIGLAAASGDLFEDHIRPSIVAPLAKFIATRAFLRG